LFWKSYPQTGRTRSGRDKAWVIWKRLGLEKHSEEILVSLEVWNRNEKWLKDGGQFIEGVHIWLKDGRWKDPPANVSAKPHAIGYKIDRSKVIVTSK